MSRSPASAPVVFSSLAAVELHPWAGVFSLDSAAVRAVHIFAARSDVPLADRAAALRSTSPTLISSPLPWPDLPAPFGALASPIVYRSST